jgi:hypothetical protein
MRLVGLEEVNPGYNKEIFCVLAEKILEDIIRKVEKSLRSERKKRGIARKASAPS